MGHHLVMDASTIVRVPFKVFKTILTLEIGVILKKLELDELGVHI